MAVVADFIVDKSFPVSSKNELKTVTFLVSTLFFSRTMCLGFTITVAWSKMPLMTRKWSFTKVRLSLCIYCFCVIFTL
jgi:hypothetical protein